MTTSNNEEELDVNALQWLSAILPAASMAAAAVAAGPTAPADLGKDGYVDSNGVKIHYVEKGSGPLVVMIHGFPDFWYSWREQIPELSKHFHVVAIDQRGYNLSDKPDGVENFRPGKLAWPYAMQHPDKMDRLVILNLPHPRGLLRELANNPDQQKASAYARNFQKPDAAKKVPAAMLAFWVHDPTAKATYVEAFKRSSMEGMLNYYKANYPRPPYKETPVDLPKVKCPVLMIHGLKDVALLQGALNGTWNWIDNEFTLVTIPHAGHFVQQDAAPIVTRTMVRWLTTP